MPESDTSTFTKAKDAVTTHGNKVFNGVSAGLIVWLFATFPSKTEFDMMKQRQSETWIAVQEIQITLMRRSAGTNEIRVVSQP